MATARERLLQALISIVTQTYSDTSASSLRRLLNSYRVQVKKGENLEKIETARGTLADCLTARWRSGEVLGKKEISKLLSPFRLQIKAGLGQNRVAAIGESKTLADTESTNATSLTRAQIKENILHHENAYFKREAGANKEETSPTVIAGGHRLKVKPRGHCPKCRSLGVVVATEYGGQGYLSCVYCGYQDHKHDPDSKVDLPLAAQFLGRAFEEPEPDDE